MIYKDFAGLYKGAAELKKARNLHSLMRLEKKLYDSVCNVFPLPPTRLDHGSIRAFCGYVQSDVKRRAYDLLAAEQERLASSERAGVIPSNAQ